MCVLSIISWPLQAHSLYYLGCLEDLVTADMCLFKAFLGEEEEVFPLSGWRRHFGEAFMFGVLTMHWFFAALLQFRGMMTTQMHFECCSTKSPWRRTLLFFFRKIWCPSHRRSADPTVLLAGPRLELVVWSRPHMTHGVQDVETCLVAPRGGLCVRPVRFSR